MRTRLCVNDEMHSLLFNPQRSANESLHHINFFNAVKKVIIRAGGPDRKINLRVFIQLIHELRTKLDIAKAGLAPEKIMRLINYGMDERSDIYGRLQQKR